MGQMDNALNSNLGCTSNAIMQGSLTVRRENSKIRLEKWFGRLDYEVLEANIAFDPKADGACQ